MGRGTGEVKVMGKVKGTIIQVGKWGKSGGDTLEVGPKTTN